MADPTASLDDLLSWGIAAARAGDRAVARDCLEPIVRADERNVQAWYWLSRVVESPEEREICLDNVLALDPGHHAVRAERAALLRARDAAAGHAREALAAPVVPATPEEIMISDAATEPLPCPYCGAISAPLDRDCPACRRPLWQRRRKTAGHSIYSLALVLVWLMQANFCWLAVCMAYLGGTLLAAVHNAPRAARVVEFLQDFFGAPGPALGAVDLPVGTVILAAGAAFGLSLVIAAGLYARLRFFYWLAAGLIVAGFVALFVQGLAAASLPFLRVGIAAVLFLLAMSLFFLAGDEYAWTRRRLAAVVDPDVDGDSALFARGRRYAAQGMWARAAAHWARAVALNPSHPDYRLALAGAYLNLGQADRAREHAEAARRLDPAGAEAVELLGKLS